MKQLLLGFVLLLAACTRYETVMTDRGPVERRVSYPTYDVIRAKKQFRLTLDEQDYFRRYYRSHRAWPLTEQGFVAESDSNYQLLRALRRRGFTTLEFRSPSADSLVVDFEFQTLGNLQLDTWLTLYGLGRELPGSFVFVANPVSGISFQQRLRPPRRPRH